MKKFIRFFTALAVFVFIFTACGGKGNTENQTPGEVKCKADGSEEFLTYAKYEEVGCRGSGCLSRGISRKTEEETYAPDIYKLDGNILWLANRYLGLVSVDVSNPKQPKRLGSIKIKGKDIIEMHIHKGTAFVVSQTSAGEGDGETGDIGIVNMGFIKITAVDISDPSKLSVSGEINIRGWLAVSSKLTGDI
ncbi:beta-propeller domain-containing protein, partial [bacterium]|nr:beta-propeller domain-containing protein [bacterium]